MSDNIPKDQLFSEIMRKSRLSMPFSDFEEKTMLRISRERSAKHALEKYKSLAVLFFIMGTGFGFGLTYFLSLPETSFAGIPSDTLLLLCRLVYVFVVLTQFNSISKLFSKTRSY